MTSKYGEEFKLRAIELYKKGLSPYEIEKKMGCHHQSVYNWLRENSIQCRTSYDDDTKDKAVNMYQEGISCIEISEELGPNFATIMNWVHKSDVDVRSPSEAQRINYECNDDFFDEIGPLQSYWIGMLAADGHATSSGNSIMLSLVDGEHIEKFKEDLNLSHKIGEFINDCGNKGYRISFSSPKIHNRLSDFGIVPNKTHSFVPVIDGIPEECLRDYWRGLVDGDGSVYISKHPVVKLHGTEDTCDEFLKYLKTQGIETTAQTTLDKNKTYKVAVNSSLAYEAAELLYGDSVRSLERKYEAYKEIVEYYE